MKSSSALMLALVLFGCGDATEVLVVTDSDMAVPGQLDSLETVVTSPSGDVQRSSADLTQRALPRTLSLVHEGGALGPFDVTVSGRLRGSVVVSRRATFSFVPDETRVLVMHLVDACRTMSCGGGQTCTENGCQSVDAPLVEWTGDPPTLGGGPPPSDAGTMCGATETSCGGVCVDTANSPEHCGRCNNRCRGSQQCIDGTCARRP